ncbi:MAG TPA: RNA polymerase sigma factor [Polyangiales bacterium]|nr:RNA polymerase sigma factor [Polyangiales bacterium]
MEPKAKARLSFASTPLGPKPAEDPPPREALDQNLSDLELLGRFHTGDHAAFAALLSRYQRPVYNFVLRSLGERQVAEDLTQEVFLRVIQGGAGFQSQSKFSTWLFTIARNLCVDHTRRMKHRKHASLDASVNPDGDNPLRLVDRIPHHQPSTDRSAAGPRIRERISRALEHLPLEQREVFLLRQVDDLPFAEIAKICDIPENTVKSRMRYALERLQTALADYEDDEGAST